MNKWVVIGSASALLFSLFGYGLWQERREQQASETLLEMERYTAIQASEAKLNEIASRISLVHSKYGELVGTRYELCLTHPPESAAHQNECAALTSRIDQDIAKLPKW